MDGNIKVCIYSWSKCSSERLPNLVIGEQIGKMSVLSQNVTLKIQWHASNSPPPVDNLNLGLGPAVAEELLVGPGRQEDGVKPEKNHEHDHGDVLGTRHWLRDSPHVQRRPHRHGACHCRDVYLLLSVSQPHGQLKNSGKLIKSFWKLISNKRNNIATHCYFLLVLKIWSLRT